MKVKIRADSVEIEGYVNAVGRDSRKMTDEYGDFVEQIQPGTFGAALNRSTEPIPILLDHRSERRLGETGTNLTLEEDTIGLHACATITDPEVIELARGKKLRGWSFGFIPMDGRSQYDYESRIERHIVTELELVEVSIIDDKQMPAYAGTSIHARSEDKKDISLRTFDMNVTYHEDQEEHVEPEEPTERSGEPEKEKKPEINPVDYTKYHETIERLRR